VADVVYLTIDKPRKLIFRHKDIRDAVIASGKQITELFGDPFVGWPYLLQAGLRFQDPKFTLDKASELIDLWVDKHKADDQPLAGLSDKLQEALEASNFIKIKKMDDGDDPTNPKVTDTPSETTSNGSSH
jgi:hypothetical protein